MIVRRKIRKQTVTFNFEMRFELGIGTQSFGYRHTIVWV